MRFRLKARCLNIVSHGSWVSELSAPLEARSPDTQDHTTLDLLHFYVVLFNRAIVQTGQILVSQLKMHQNWVLGIAVKDY